MPSFRSFIHQTSEQAASATGKAYQSLKNDILHCELPPGSQIYEGETAERLGMSKTPVREALGMLAHEGFVEVRPRQGDRVTDVTFADVQEVFQLRLLLEPAAAELAAERASPEHLQKLKQTVDEEPSDSHQDEAHRSARFHATLAEASGNSRLAATLHNLLDEMHRLQFIGLERENDHEKEASEHRDLLDALLKGNHHLARDIAQRHVESDRMRVFEAILGSITGDGAAIASSQIRLRPGNAD